MTTSVPDTRFLTVRGMPIRVAVQGAGPPLLLITGLGANIEIWHPLMRELPGRELIAFDAPGAGASPAPRRPLRMRHLADLVADLLDALGRDRVDVLGYSLGGAIAQQLAYQHPSRVRRLVLAGTTPGLGGVQRPSMVAHLFDPRRHGKHAQEIRDRTGGALFGGRAARDPAALAAYEAARAAFPPTRAGYYQQLLTVSGWSSMRWLHRITAPTLVLAGTEDPLVPPVNASILARRMPRARRHFVAGAGHLFLHDQPEDVAPVIEQFLDEDDGG